MRLPESPRQNVSVENTASDGADDGSHRLHRPLRQSAPVQCLCIGAEAGAAVGAGIEHVAAGIDVELHPLRHAEAGHLIDNQARGEEGAGQIVPAMRDHHCHLNP